MEWIPVADRLPEDETPVLIVRHGVVRIGERCWDHPGHEDTYQSYWYWDDPQNDGQCWERDEITHWMPLPPLPFNAELNGARRASDLSAELGAGD